MGNSKKEANDVSINEMDYLQITSDIKESPRIQKTEYIRQQMLKRRAMEDALMEDLKQEQSVIDSFRDQINDGLIQTEELSRYNQEFRENMTEQIYLLHGISKDKLEGMQECKNAFRRGYSIILFLLSTALVILCGALYGFQSEICVLMLAITGIEGAMLAQDRSLDHYPILRLINRVLFPLLFPLMMTMFICFEMNFMPYGLLLPYIAMAGIVILFLSAVPYFIYDPYKGMGKHMRDAKAEIKVVEKVAKKEISKNQRIRIREEKKELADQTKENRRQERIAKKEALEEARNAKKEAKKQARNARKASKNQESIPQKDTEQQENSSLIEEEAQNESKTSVAATQKNESESITKDTPAEADSEKTAAESTTNVTETDSEQAAAEATTNAAETDSEQAAAEATTNAAETGSEQAVAETTKPAPKKRRTRKKNPVIDITEGAQNLAAQS
ncbi:MAG: hypothetical protein K2K96_02965 [Lachnospiraceae bacterium]|nr:hypothetical protein [Lachnospiraceae bacterium]